MSIVKNINVKINTKNTNINAKMSTNKDVSFDATIDKPDFIYENDYNQMLNKPQINNITLEGNKTPKDLNMTTSQLTNDGDGSSPFATEDYVNENGGKIDSISVNNVNQEIDENKNVNIDLNNYVTFTDYMSSSKAGIAKLGSDLGILTDIDNQLYTVKATEDDINNKTDNYKVIVSSNLDYAVKSGLANSKIEWNDEDKTNARNTINAVSNSEFESHVNDLNNPHNVTKAQVGLSNVDNTSDLNKPISTLTQQAINNEIERATAKENEISQTLQNEMNTRVQEHSEIQEQIDTINSKIPNQASSTNQLADKNFVNSSINSSAAFFKGNFATKAALDAIQWQTTDSSLTTYVSNNDYAYVEADETHNNEAWRYIYVKDDSTSEWQPQFKVNNAPFTAEQLAAINSGATSDLINSISSKLTQDAIVDSTGDSSTKAISQRAATLAAQLVQNNLDTHINNKNNPHSVNKSQIGLSNVDNTSDIDKPISTAVQEEFNNYLPLSAGIDKKLTGDLYFDNNKFIKGYTTELTLRNLIGVNTVSDVELGDTNANINVKAASAFRPATNNEITLGTDTLQWKEIHGTTIYQGSKQVANKEDLTNLENNKVNITNSDTTQNLYNHIYNDINNQTIVSSSGADFNPMSEEDLPNSSYSSYFINNPMLQVIQNTYKDNKGNQTLTSISQSSGAITLQTQSQNGSSMINVGDGVTQIGDGNNFYNFENTSLNNTNNADLGTLTNKFKDLYLSGKLSNGTNEVTIDDIINNSRVIYQTTGQNTDGAMSQKATTDTLNGKANLSGGNAFTGTQTFDNIIVKNEIKAPAAFDLYLQNGSDRVTKFGKNADGILWSDGKITTTGVRIGSWLINQDSSGNLIFS